ncbi:MAG: 4-hydroxy-2-oxovalerate aldolase [Sedimentibacter sp.]|uniref:4-hydroxy-2-oxovalerate aldolase n=1 Tax=Sedimentibacter sp. TaxID=1960295 RepID=UPI003159152D
MKIKVIDTTLRDGNHALNEQLTPGQVKNICSQLDNAGLYAVEVGLGTGLGGSIPHNCTNTIDLLKAARGVLKKTKLATLFVPGIGDLNDLRQGADVGLDLVRIAVLCTKVDSAIPFIQAAKKMNLQTCVFLMASHILLPNELATQAKIVQDAGSDFIYIGDSIGAMTSKDISDRVCAVSKAVTIPLGIHTHNSLGLAVSNAVEGVNAGCNYIDGTLEGLGEGGGNGNLQAIVAVCEKLGIHTGVDFNLLNHIAEKSLRPLMLKPQELRSNEIAEGFSGELPQILKNLE